MHEHFNLISTLAAGFGLALIFGFIAARLKLPALVGYLIAGIIIGPYTPGFVADAALANELAEIGIMLLMFGVGLHFSFEDLLSVRRIALPGAVVQILVATTLGAGISSLWGWSIGAGIVFGLALSVASTVVLVKALESRSLMDSVNGRIAIGWLVVEDLVLILILVLLPPLSVMVGGTGQTAVDGGSAGLLLDLALTLGKVAVFIGLMLAVGRRLFPWLLWQVARLGSRELFTLCIIAAAVGIAYGAGMLFGVSFALGAFFAGMVLRGSDLSYRAAEESLPLRDAFSVLFFVSVGMLFNPMILFDEPLKVLVVVAIIMLGKSLAAFLIVLVFRYPIHTALTVSASLAQIGEFSFILAGIGLSLGLLPAQGQSLILAGAILSIALNPLAFKAIIPLQNWIARHRRLAHALERQDPLAALPAAVESRHVTGHVVLIGYGRVGREIFTALSQKDIPVVVVEQNRESVEKLRSDGHKAVCGDASEPTVLVQAHVARAKTVIIGIPDAIRVRKVIEIAGILNPGVETLARSHSEEDSAFLRKAHVGQVFLGEHELAISMVNHVLRIR